MTSRRRADRTDAGDTLVEVVIAVVILGITVAGLLGALIASAGASTEHRSLTTVDTVLRSYAETAKYDIELQTSPWFDDCAPVTSTTYNGHPLVAPYVPSGWSQPYIVGIRYWNNSTGAFDDTNTPGGYDNSGCEPGDFQVLTLSVVAPDGSGKTLTLGIRSPT